MFKAKPALIVIAALAIAGAVLAIVGFVFAATSQSQSSAGVSSAKTEAAPHAAPAAVESNETPTVRTADDVIMTLPGSVDTYVLQGEEYLEPGCHAVDPDGGDITSTVNIQGNVDTSKPGDYEITYTATTDDGAQAKATRNVHVVNAFDEPATSLPVLMYHYVYSADNPPEELNGNYILDTDLAGQMAYLAENGYYYPSFQEVKAFAEGSHTLPAKSVVVTFDDGEKGFLETGIPVLEEYKVSATSFVICSDADAAEKIHNYASEYVSFQSHSYAMHQAGSDIGRGGRIHAMTEAEIADDLRQAQAILGTTEAFAYPFGDNNEAAQEALRETGVLCGFTIVNDRVYPGDDPTILSRVRISGDYTQDGFEWSVAPNAA